MTKTDVTSCKVAMLTGGWSEEHEIAKESAASCEKALRDAGFTQVDVYDVADKGVLSRLENGNYDVAFIAMHGKWGEDGCVQGMCEMLHLPYTFSGVLASAMATEKDIAKTVFAAAGIPVPKGITVEHPEQLTDDDLNQMVADLHLPLFVKPAANGSSFGVTKVEDLSQLKGAIELASAEGDAALVEECIVGTEITVPVIGNDNPEALPIVEIVMGESGWYDLQVKYEPAELHHVIPARLPEDVYKRAQELACKAHVALGCRGCSRSDFIVTPDGVPYILETNPIPGMTERSLLPDVATRSGIGFPQLCRRFVEMALERAE